MDCCEKWKPFAAMVAVDFALAVVNILLKKVLNEGVNHLLIVTYRQSISAIFLSLIAFFWESLFACKKGRPKLTPLILGHLFFSALVHETRNFEYVRFLAINAVNNNCRSILNATITLMIQNYGYTHAVLLPSWAAIYINFHMCFHQHGASEHIYYGIAIWARESEHKEQEWESQSVRYGGFYEWGTSIDTIQRNAINKSPPETRGTMVQKIEHVNKRWLIGSVVLSAGSLMWSLWFLLQARIGKRYPCQYSSTAIKSFFSAIQSAILGLIIDRNVSNWIVKGKFEISSLIYAVKSGLCYVVMSWCVKKRGPLFTAAFSPFIQAFVAIFDISILHEQIHLESVLGSTFVVVGMYILLWGKSNEADNFIIKDAPTMKGDEDCNIQLSCVIPVTVTAGNLSST
ncbi:hypothetical protein HYC85_010416 [Camellia sinensis]|uniref:WAT1-related protein n=1 Tax=Camellia sinensis TaxID=4442 RepID=A0A7J7HHT9_CAMSI|nr:hypothetical protein HYC85_010416 [Camellia sinensis]